jgi:hypothetical protein
VTIAGTSTPLFLLESNTVSVKVITHGVNDPPTFDVPSEFVTLEGAGLQVVSSFVSYSAGPPDEYGQVVSFAIAVATDVSRLFVVAPRIDGDGTLTFETAPGTHGRATLYIKARDNGGVANGGVDVVGPKLVSFLVFPRPRIFGLSPRLGPIYGGTDVTLRGAYFGSEYSRGYYAAVYEGISVRIGDKSCQNVTFVADGEVVCQTPPGVGAASVSLHINEGGLTRAVDVEGGFNYAILYYVGALGSAEPSGYFGFGPSSEEPGTYHSPGGSLSKGQLRLSNAANTLLSVDGVIYIGGGFEFANGVEVNNVLLWDGSSYIMPLGFGTDGAVKTLASFQGKVVVGGDFQRVFQVGSRILKAPLIAFWDGSEWSALGDLVLTGSVSVAVTHKDALYVGGQFQAYSTSEFNGLAKYADGKWLPVGGGVGTGKVIDVKDATCVCER